MTHKNAHTTQRGALLLEGLIGILLFSVGILAVVALQGSATKAVTQAKFRSDASLLADQLIGQIWSNRSNATAYAFCGGGGAPAVLNNWMTEVNTRLPNSNVYPPCVAVVPTVYAGPPAYTANQVTVTLSWQLPDELARVPTPPPHSVTFSTVINWCPTLAC